MGIATYLVLNVSVLGLLLLSLRGLLSRSPRMWRILLLHLLLLTIVFDGLIVALNIVAYDPTKIIGITLGPMPIEDMFYTIAGIVMIPAFWQRYKKKGDNHAA